MKKYHQRQLRKGGLWALLLLAVGGSLSACRDKAIDDLSAADSPVYITNYDKSVNFGQYKTFSLPDSVLVETNNGYQPAQNSVSTQLSGSTSSIRVLESIHTAIIRVTGVMATEAWAGIILTIRPITPIRFLTNTGKFRLSI